MTDYLAIARRIPPVSGCEKSEISEKRSAQAERLQARIVAVATAAADVFDRAELDRLWAEWTALEAAASRSWDS